MSPRPSSASRLHGIRSISALCWSAARRVAPGRRFAARPRRAENAAGRYAPRHRRQRRRRKWLPARQRLIGPAKNRAMGRSGVAGLPNSCASDGGEGFEQRGNTMNRNAVLTGLFALGIVALAPASSEAATYTRPATWALD